MVGEAGMCMWMRMGIGVGMVRAMRVAARSGASTSTSNTSSTGVRVRVAQLHPLVAVRGTSNRLPLLLLALGRLAGRPPALELEPLQLLDAAGEGGDRERRRQLAVDDAAVEGAEEGYFTGGGLVLRIARMTMGRQWDDDDVTVSRFKAL